MMKKIFITYFAVIMIMLSLTGCFNNTKNESAEYSYESENQLNIEYFHPYDDTYLKELREKYQLDEIVKDAESEFEKAQAITKWVSNLWKHDGRNEPEKSDPLSILDEVVENGQQFRCVEYGVVIYGCLNALGIPARTLQLKTEDVETRASGAGHVVCEVYLKDLKKWAFLDGQWGMIPTLNDIPLNGVEFAQALADKEKHGNDLDVINLQPQNEKNQYFQWIQEYLYYFDFRYWYNDDGTMLSKKIMLTPINAKNPTIFQKEFELDIDIYTHSVTDFYPAME